MVSPTQLCWRCHSLSLSQRYWVHDRNLANMTFISDQQFCNISVFYSKRHQRNKPQTGMKLWKQSVIRMTIIVKINKKPLPIWNSPFQMQNWQLWRKDNIMIWICWNGKAITLMAISSLEPLLLKWINFIPAWISNSMPKCGMKWFCIPKFKWISNFITHFIMDVIIYPCWGWS